MIKNIVRLEHTIADKAFHFYCDHDASTTMIKESLCQFMKFVGQIEDQVKAQIDASAPPMEPPIPDVLSEPVIPAELITQ